MEENRTDTVSRSTCRAVCAYGKGVVYFVFELSILDSARIEIQQLWLGTSLFLAIIMLLSKTRIFNSALAEKKYTTKNKLIFIVLFSVIGIWVPTGASVPLTESSIPGP